MADKRKRKNQMPDTTYEIQRGFTPLEIRISNRACPVRKTFSNGAGFTSIELIMTIAMASIVILGVGVVLVDSHRGWTGMYGRVFSDVVTDSYVARKAFDAVVRKASTKRCEPGSAGEFVELYYYNDLSSGNLDRYARFTIAGNELQVVSGSGQFDAEGTWQVTSASSAVMLARNVTYGSLSVDGPCVRMILKLDNGSETMTVATSAVRHNK